MRLSLLSLSCVATLLLLNGCTKEHTQADQKTATVHAPIIATVLPEFGIFGTQISATASVQPAPDGIVSVTSPASGTVDKIHVTVGDKVSPTLPLITIRSSDVSDVKSDQLSAQAAYAQAKHVYEMNKELFKLGAITANELALSQSNLQQTDAMLKGYSQKLNYYGASSAQSLTLHSPINGVVYEVGTHLGEKVTNDASQILVKIANPHKKMVVATVYEKDLSAYIIGKHVEIRTDNNAIEPIQGTITYISDVLDPENKTNKVYIKPNVDAPQLRINMFASISLSADIKNVFRIPKKALLFKEGKFIVFVKNGTQFIPLNVTLVSDDPKDDFSLIKGLPQNTPIALEAITLEKQ